MATIVRKKAVKKPSRTGKQSFVSPFSYYWKKPNFILFGIGVVLALIGFYLSSVKPWDSQASLVYSPIILVLTYVVIFPLSILYSSRKKVEEVTEPKESQ